MASYYDKAAREVEAIVKRLTRGDLARVMNVFKSSDIEEELDQAATAALRRTASARG